MIYFQYIVNSLVDTINSAKTVNEKRLKDYQRCDWKELIEKKQKTNKQTNKQTKRKNTEKMKQWSKIGVSLRTCVINFGIN